MTGNEALSSAMQERGLKQAELADAVNTRLIRAGREGTVSDRTVRNWLTGKTRWPHLRQRAALEALFGCTAEELGFRPPARTRPASEPEHDVRRRKFFSAATGTTAAIAVPFVGAPPQVGTSDVIRLRSGLDALMALDDTRGGHEGLEKAALAGAAEALDKQKKAATQRIRQRLFSVAADYTATAAWSALDARHMDRSYALLGKALYLAGMGQDPVVEFRVWNSYFMLARLRGEATEAIDSGLAAQSTTITKRDPFFASLAHARTAVGHAYSKDRQPAVRSLGYAWEALEKADKQEPRASWVAFYGPAELMAMTAIIRDRIGDSDVAEAASHKALGTIPKHFRRNRALATGRLALAQLHQHDIDQACATASRVFELMKGDLMPGRVRSLLGDYHRDLITLAPDAGIAREWGDRYRSEWRRA
ncbi:helix-turn-helix transcriptional regulator [Streptomyces apricus]|uniref:Helix-turn-helix transcriptional regulator n=1 Tax=Streptomyces apricus TaxID=1828112 RepID=A0A5B0AEJ2_9ACTN|nr:helix-turn-helix transcriptional regulator [Streptomyces apricus]KAA0927015.1 helix-turn-helix transcriptional regulator [Streptomyces apricus]